MSKALDDLNVSELRHELRERQLSSKGKKEELRERLESWLVENGFDVDDYEFVDPYLKKLRDDMDVDRKLLRDEIGADMKILRDEIGADMKILRDEIGADMKILRDEIGADMKTLRDEIGADIKIIRDEIGDNIKRLEGKTNDTDMNKPKENLDFKMQDIRAEIDSLRQKQENVEDSTSGGFHDNLQIGVNIVDEIDNVELKECLTHVEGITPVSDVPVLCPIASFVSVEKRTEDIVDGSTLGGTKAMLPYGEESVEELGKEGCAEKIDVGLNKSSSANVEVAESEIVDRVESADGNRESEVLDGCEAMDCSMSLTSEVRIEPFYGTVEDHPGVDEAVKMISQVLSWWRFKCSVIGYWGRQGDYREEWNCRNLRVAIDSRQGIRGPCLVKEVAGWTIAVAARLHFSGEGLLGRWLTRRSRGRDCIPRVKMKPFGCTWQGVCSGRTDLRRGQCYNPENAIN